MKLKFKRAVSAGRRVYRPGEVVEVADLHAAEVYVAHGYAEAAGDKEVGTTTLGARSKGQSAKSQEPGVATPKSGRRIPLSGTVQDSGASAAE